MWELAKSNRKVGFAFTGISIVVLQDLTPAASRQILAPYPQHLLTDRLPFLDQLENLHNVP